MKSIYVISYDIKNGRRLNRVHRYLKGKGIHVQKSVFYFLLSKEELKKLQIGLKQIIKNSEDDVRIYPLSSSAEAIIMGKGDKVPEGVLIFLD